MIGRCENIIHPALLRPAMCHRFVLKRPESAKETLVESSGPSVLLKADMSGAEERAAVDTGSGVNCISKEEAEKYPVPLQKYDGTVYHAEGRKIRLLGEDLASLHGRLVCTKLTFW